MSDFGSPGGAPGLEIWRIEKLIAVALPKKEYGTFNEGDSYIVLKTTQTKSALTFDLFCWLGADSPVDEMGIAAYKAVELDDMLGGRPIQHRETQGHESEEFQQCFKKLQYRKGAPRPCPPATALDCATRPFSHFRWRELGLPQGGARRLRDAASPLQGHPHGPREGTRALSHVAQRGRRLRA